MPSIEISSSDVAAPTAIMDLPTDCLTFVFQSLSCAADQEAFGLTCHLWLQIQNLNRQSLRFECSQGNLVVGHIHLHRLLTRFPNLVSLSLSGCTQLPDSSLVQVRHCISGLRVLLLDCCLCITDNGISSVASGCPLLKCISLYHCNVTDVGLESMAKSCSAVEDINLSYCQLITDNGINTLLRNCLRLSAMRVSNCWGVDGTGFEGCSQALAYLEANSSDLSPKGIKCIVSGGGLEYLNISNQGRHVYRDGFAAIGGGFGVRLRFLNMRLCRAAGDESAEVIAKGCPLLEEWNLALCHGIGLSGWVAIASYCHCLVKLHVSRCRNISDNGLMALRNGCKKLSVLYINGCSRVSSNAIEVFRMVRGDVEISKEEIITIGPAWAFGVDYKS